MKTIRIDFDIHQLIEAERRSFEEPENLALRRLLDLPDVSGTLSEASNLRGGLPFVEDGVSIKHGSKARMSYLRGAQQFQGEFLDGQLVVDGKSYPSLSAAACDLARTKAGKRTSLNGWNYWEVCEPHSDLWIPMSDLREENGLDDIVGSLDLSGIEL